MKTQLKTFKKIFDDGKRYVVPEYQREYSWKKSECVILLSSIKELLTKKEEGKELFLGFLMFFSRKRTKEKNENSIIIDGQQRMITFSLLVMVMIENVYKKTADLKSTDLQELEEIIADKSYAPNLRLSINSGIDYDAYRWIWGSIKREFGPIKTKKVQKTQTFEFKSEALKKTQIYENFKFIETYYQENFLDETQEIMTFLKKNLKFLVISLTEKEQEKYNNQGIFETLNSTGKALKADDLIKNYILLNTEFSSVSEKDMELVVRDYWKPWIKMIKIDDKSRKKRNFFKVLHYVVSSKETLDKHKELDGEKTIYQCFKDFFYEFKKFDLGEKTVYLDWLAKFFAVYFCVSTERKGEKVEDRQILNQLSKMIEGEYITKIAVKNNLKSFGEEIKIPWMFLSLIFENKIIDQETFQKVFASISVGELILRIFKGKIGQLSPLYNMLIQNIKEKIEVNLQISKDQIFQRPSELNGSFEDYRSKNSFKLQHEILQLIANFIEDNLEKEFFQSLLSLKEAKISEIFVEKMITILNLKSKGEFKLINRSILKFTTGGFACTNEVNIEHIWPESKSKGLEGTRINNLGNIIYLEKEHNKDSKNLSLGEKLKYYEKSKSKEMKKLILHIKDNNINEWSKEEIKAREKEKIREFLQKIKKTITMLF